MCNKNATIKTTVEKVATDGKNQRLVNSCREASLNRPMTGIQKVRK